MSVVGVQRHQQTMELATTLLWFLLVQTVQILSKINNTIDVVLDTAHFRNVYTCFKLNSINDTLKSRRGFG